MASSIASRIEASFRKQGLMDTLGARITRIEPGCVEITAPLTPATQQQQGFAHAGLTFATGDSVAGYSALASAGAFCTEANQTMAQGKLDPIYFGAKANYAS